MTRDEFFARVSGILGEQSPGSTTGRENWHKGPDHIWSSRGRWHRGAGAGRFPGHGVIRYFGPTSIHVSLHTPSITESFSDPEAAIRAIALAMLIHLGQQIDAP